MSRYIKNAGRLIVQTLTISQKLEVCGHDDLGRLYGYYELGTESAFKKIQKGIRNGSRRRR
jgi:hypothetical protein